MTVSILPKTAHFAPRSDWARRLFDAGRITPADVRQLRFRQFPLGLPGRADAEALFALDRALLDKSADWGDLVSELLSDHLVWGERPTGTLTHDGANWILSEVDRQPTSAGLATLVALMDEAASAPSWFSAAVRRRVAEDWRHTAGRPLAA
jgi:hypothetical protein